MIPLALRPLLLLLIGVMPMAATPAHATTGGEPPWGLAIHGGAGTIERAAMTPEQDAAYRAELAAALDAGYAILEQGGSAQEAVLAAIVILEDAARFNAGRGAVFTHEGEHELDASLMDGRNRAAGAVAGVQGVKNPILLAARVMTASPHVLLSGDGARTFAEEQGLALVPDDYFSTPRRWEQIQQRREREGHERLPDRTFDEDKFGTVGAVARDQAGNLAAGTSTGGMTNKRWGRIGDSPLIGAGTFADNATCAVSCTGHGEYFIRWAVAYDVAALMQYTDCTLAEAAHHVIHEKLVEVGGRGGLIAIDRDGKVALPHNTPGMYRGYRLSNGKEKIAIYGDED